MCGYIRDLPDTDPEYGPRMDMDTGQKQPHEAKKPVLSDIQS